MNIKIQPIDKILALEMVFNTHYSKIMPRLTKHYLGAFVDNKLVGILTLGWGTRPLHTIKKLFPSLTSKDYYEIGKMCMLEEMPKNTESQLLSSVIKWIKINEPQIKILYTWADGIIGKPGYVYQSANFLYGGYIWTDLYVTNTGEKVHPRTSQGLTDKGDKKCGHRPTKKYLLDNGWNHYKGKQFRYLYFLCNNSEKRKLMKESVETWGINYPKHKDLEWQKLNLNTEVWENVDKIDYNQSQTSDANKTVLINKQKIDNLNKARDFFDI
jgi:hypothetical protein